MADLFISYGRPDRHLVDQLSEALERLGYSTWYDVDMAAGSAWRDRLVTEIRQSQATIVLWTNDSSRSQFVAQEVDEAIENEKPVIALRVKGFEPNQVPIGLRHIQMTLNTDITAIDVALRGAGVRPAYIGKTATDAMKVTPYTVFGRATPDVTLVDRTKTDAAVRLLADVGDVGKLVRVCGPTKSGKTVLINQALQDKMPIYVPGGPTQSFQVFLDFLWLGVDPSAMQTPSEAVIFTRLAQSKRPIVIDDYHRIATQTRRAIIKRVQSLLTAEIPVVLVSWTEIDEDLIQADPGLSERRTPTIYLPLWKDSEIALIGKLGFLHGLNARLSRHALTVLTRQSFRNPHLMQQHCLMYAVQGGISQRQSRQVQIGLDDDRARSIFTAACKETKQHFLQLLEKKGAPHYELKTGKSATVNGLIVLAVMHMEPIHAMSMGTLAKGMRQLLSCDAEWITTATAENAVRDFMKQLEGNPHRNTCIDFAEGKLHIHPFFKRFLLWDFAPSKGFDYPNLLRYKDVAA